MLARSSIYQSPRNDKMPRTNDNTSLKNLSNSYNLHTSEHAYVHLHHGHFWHILFKNCGFNFGPAGHNLGSIFGIQNSRSVLVYELLAVIKYLNLRQSFSSQICLKLFFFPYEKNVKKAIVR